MFGGEVEFVFVGGGELFVGFEAADESCLFKGAIEGFCLRRFGLNLC